jgi:hypothetical protein
MFPPKRYPKPKVDHPHRHERLIPVLLFLRMYQHFLVHRTSIHEEGVVLRLQVYSSVIYKLLIFTFAMISVPIGSYFLLFNTVFKGM